jgi:hypothetical protein
MVKYTDHFEKFGIGIEGFIGANISWNLLQFENNDKLIQFGISTGIALKLIILFIKYSDTNIYYLYYRCLIISY